MEAELKTERERKDSECKIEYREDPQMTADGGGCPQNMETIAVESHQWKEESDSRQNKKPLILRREIRSSAATVTNTSTASPSLEVMLQELDEPQPRTNTNKVSKTPEQTGKTETV